MTAYIDFTEAELRHFAPSMKPFYRDTLLSETGKRYLREAGILDNAHRWCHFMAQVGAETGGGTVLRESLSYSSVKRIRQVWRARSRYMSDAQLKKLVGDPVALGDWAYGARMGNAKGTSDGYDYRGGGWLQTTGKSAVARYCAKLGIPLRKDILDDPEVTLRFACLEWHESGCNLLADENDLLGISKAINTGGAKSSVIPNGMEHRQAYFDRARALWWDADPVEEGVVPLYEAHAKPAPAASAVPTAKAGLISDLSFAKLNELADQGSRLAQHIRALKTWLWGLVTTFWTAATLVNPTKGTGSVIGTWIASHPILAAAILGTLIAAVLYVLAKLAEKYLLTASESGRYQPRPNEPEVST